MYLNFYALNKEPFHVTPDPDFLFLSKSHKEAFGTVMYGVQQKKGFMAITGEVGTGKTTVLRAFMERAQDTDILPIYLFDPNLSYEELLAALLRELGREASAETSAATRTQALQCALVDQFKQDRNVVLLIDEAQNMPVETLEKLRLLSNLETTKSKLLQIVLVGQPELQIKLDLHELRQLKQRIAVRTDIEPLSRKDSFAYIEHRLNEAGAKVDTIFTPSTMKCLVSYGQGNPRRLNTVCDNALVSGYGEQRRPVNLRIAREVIADLKGKKSRPYLKYLLPLAAMVLILISAPFAWSMLHTQVPEADPAQATANTETQVASRRPLVDSLPTAVPDPTVKEALAPPAPVSAPPDFVRTPAPVDPPALTITAEAVEKTETPATPRLLGVVSDAKPWTPPEKKENDLSGKTPDPKPSLPKERRSEDGKMVQRLVMQGDTLIGLIIEVYGTYNRALLEHVMYANPHLDDYDTIRLGRYLSFPTLTEEEIANTERDSDYPDAQGE